MIKKPVTIKISAGLENRPVAQIVQTASQYESRIYLESGNKHVNAKSIMGMMTLNLTEGENMVISTEGKDEEEATEKLESLLVGNIASIG